MKKQPSKKKRILTGFLLSAGFAIIGTAITFPITHYFVKNNVESKFISIWEIFQQSKFYNDNFKNWSETQTQEIQKIYSPANFVLNNSSEHINWEKTFASIGTIPI